MKVSLMEVKEALKDPRFRDTLPQELREGAAKFLTNPGCGCNRKFLTQVLQTCTKQLKDYFPGAEIVEEAKEVAKIAKNNWRVINCHVKDLEAELKKLPPGRKQIDVARFQDQATVVINELDIIY